MTFAWLLTPWGKRAMAAVAVLMLLLAARAYFVSEGKKQGRAEETQVVADDQQKTVARKYDAGAAEIAALQAEIETLRKRSETLEALSFSLAAQRQAIPQQVNALSADAIAAAVAKAIGPGTDLSKPLTLEQQRTVLTCFEERSKCDEQLKAKDQQIVTAQAETAKTEAKYQDAAKLTADLYQSYADLWNWKANPKRGLRCLGLWRCVRPHIEAPDPKRLLHPGTETKSLAEVKR